MISYVALLHGINLIGQRPVSVDELNKYFELAGFTNIRAFIQTGIILFDSDETNESLIQSNIEDFIYSNLGYRVNVLIRMIHDVKKVIKNNPFDNLSNSEKQNLYVTFLSNAPAPALRGALGVYSNDAEYARVVNKEVYVYSPNYGMTCFSNNFIERKLGVTATTRNWATITKLPEL
ncbi:MAG: DUF1697 domain-containing protein [Flavipsychrobacter sp.]|nr:DUF1697 domain-containing protein [Flavipsychrobacter sp.]